MNTLVRRPALVPFSALCVALCIALLLALAGCGPGIGGTGTGSDLEGPTSASPAPAALCDSDLAPLLNCTPGATAAGSTLSLWADGTATRELLLRLEGNAVDVEAACGGWQFSGVWATQGGQAARFHGQWRRSAGAAAEPATLTAQREGTALVVQLFDAGGRALGAPVVLQRVASAPPARACS